MERIKIHTTAAFDRMSIMQKRYHEHQEALRSTSDLSRPNSNASQFDDSNVSCHTITVRYMYLPVQNIFSTSLLFVNVNWLFLLLLLFMNASVCLLSVCCILYILHVHMCPSGKLTIEIHRHDQLALAHALDRAVCIMLTTINLKMETIVLTPNNLRLPALMTHRTTGLIHAHVR